MTLPKTILDFLHNKARDAHVTELKPDDDLLKTVFVDSFSLVELVLLIEEECGFKIPDTEVDNPAHFQSINALSRYIESRKGLS